MVALAAPDPGWEQKVEHRLSRRLAEHAEDLDRGHEGAARGGSGAGVESRGLLVNAWTEAFRRHCDRVLADFAGLLREAGGGGAAPWLEQRFSAHVDGVVARTLQALAEHRTEGMSVTASERKRFANLASGLKAEAKGRLEEEAAGAELGARLTSGEAGERDDRLPLYRRGMFDRDLAQLVHAAQQAHEPISLIMIDLDDFKKVNDEHGHPVGDEVLLTASQIVVKSARGKGQAYRYGGDEMALLLPNYALEEAVALAERIRLEIGAARMGSRCLQITASFGVASERATTPDALLERADKALYAAKRSGRNRVCGSE